MIDALIKYIIMALLIINKGRLNLKNYEIFKLASVGFGNLDFNFAVDFGIFRNYYGIMEQYNCRSFSGNIRSLGIIWKAKIVIASTIK